MINQLKINRLILRTIVFQQSTTNTQLRQYSNYRNSPDISIFKPTVSQYDVSRSTDEWKYIERLLQSPTVPRIIPQQLYQSNWKPPAAKPGDHSYYINRNRNHMIPVYMLSTHRGMRKITQVCKIQGDIHDMEKDLKQMLEHKSGRVVASQVNELVGVIRFKGDHVNIIKDYLMDKGF